MAIRGKGNTITFVKSTVNGLSKASSMYVPITDRDSSTTSTAQLKPIGASSFDFGLKYLTGCTALIVISHTAVYGAHFFEDQSMRAGEDTYATNLLNNGGPGFTALRGETSQALGKTPQIFILTPMLAKHNLVDQPEDSMPAEGFRPGFKQYQRVVNDIAATLRELFPGVMPTVQEYKALNINNAADRSTLDNTAAGRLLFQFNPNYNGVKTMRLFFETKKMLSACIMG